MMETYVIHVTKECNCACLYCYEKDKTSGYEWPEIKKLVDEIVKYAPHDDDGKGIYGIEFLGGEPTLRMDLIKKVVEYTNAMWYVITTNGTVVTDELTELLLDNNNVVWAASVDGGLLANSMRLTKDGFNTFPMVQENLKKLLDAGVGDGQLGAHMVTTPYNVHSLAKNVGDLYKAGFLSIGVGIVESTMIIDQWFADMYVSQMEIVSDQLPDGLRIAELDSLKPISDQRYYIKDASGKTIGESYGRAEGDIVSNGDVTAIAVGSNVSGLIDEMRRKAYEYHKNNVGERIT